MLYFILDPLKDGSSEQIRAVRDSFNLSQDAYKSVRIHDKDSPSNADSDHPVFDINELETGDVVCFSDYGVDLARAIKGKYEDNVKVVLTTHTLERADIRQGLEDGIFGMVGAPAHALGFVQGTSNLDRVVPLVGVPHELSEATIKAKYDEWKELEAQSDNTPDRLPEPREYDCVMTVVLPGDVDGVKLDNGATGNAFYTPEEAVKHAQAIGANIQAKKAEGKTVFLCLSNSPRTYKYKTAEGGGTDPDNMNANRFKGMDENPVNKAFYDEIQNYVDADDIAVGYIQPSVPKQGFLAFYHVMNENVKAGGEAVAYIDGISTIMLAQAIDILPVDTPVVAIDSPAKTPTHQAGMDDLHQRGLVDILRRENGRYRYDLSVAHDNTGQQAQVRLSDAKTVAREMVSKLMMPGFKPKADGHKPKP